MRRYETLLLLNPELTSENREAILGGLTGIVERENGAILAVDDWGLRDLAYPVKKQTRGNYVRLEYAVAGAVVAEIERIIRITDGIFKFVTVLLDDDYKVEGATA